ncbi:MAG: glycine cleavage system protein R [Chloroflexota bacterium]
MMDKRFVLTLTGADRIGIVEHVTELLLECGGDVHASRMARLGGEFAMLLLVSVPEVEADRLPKTVERLQGEDFKVSVTETEWGVAARRKDWLPYRIEVRGANHEGIIHKIAERLAQMGINIESIETNVTPAPMSGAPLFTMDAIVVVPPDLPKHKWQDDLEEAADAVNVELTVSLYKD